VREKPRATRSTCTPTLSSDDVTSSGSAARCISSTAVSPFTDMAHLSTSAVLGAS
jgi:hypothetical protein